MDDVPVTPDGEQDERDGTGAGQAGLEEAPAPEPADERADRPVGDEAEPEEAATAGAGRRPPGGSRRRPGRRRGPEGPRKTRAEGDRGPSAARRPKSRDGRSESVARAKAARNGRRQPRRRIGMAGCLRGCLSLLVGAAILALLIGAATWYVLYRPENPQPPNEPVQVEIRKGEGSTEIAAKLAKAGVVGNSLMFRLQARMDEADSGLKPGVYDLKTGMDYATVIEILSLGPPIKYVTVAVPEGLTLAQISKRIEEQTGIPAKEFETAARTQRGHYDYPFLASNTTKSLEGYLFPKTYRIREGATTDQVIDMMLKQFGRETSGLDIAYAQNQGLSFHDVVTVASMVEREAKTQRDRPLVASVIYNRLKRGMRLEIDATVQYLLGNKPKLLYRDLRIDSPYNTYLRKGLPPGPIASPGLAALRAAAKPAKTDYYFYVLTGRDGSHSFAATEAEFLRLKQRAKQGLR